MSYGWKAAEGIARVFYRTVVDRKIVFLPFIKRPITTPPRELKVARQRMKEHQHALAACNSSRKRHSPNRAFVRLGDELAEEFAFLDEVLKARAKAGLTQAEVAERMWHHAVRSRTTGIRYARSTPRSLRCSAAQAWGNRVELRVCAGVRSKAGKAVIVKKAPNLTEQQGSDYCEALAHGEEDRAGYLFATCYEKRSCRPFFLRSALGHSPATVVTST